jgi:hypothetical protein
VQLGEHSEEAALEGVAQHAVRGQGAHLVGLLAQPLQVRGLRA